MKPISDIQLHPGDETRLVRIHTDGTRAVAQVLPVDCGTAFRVTNYDGARDLVTVRAAFGHETLHALRTGGTCCPQTNYESGEMWPTDLVLTWRQLREIAGHQSDVSEMAARLAAQERALDALNENGSPGVAAAAAFVARHGGRRING